MWSIGIRLGVNERIAILVKLSTEPPSDKMINVEDVLLGVNA